MGSLPSQTYGCPVIGSVGFPPHRSKRATDRQGCVALLRLVPLRLKGLKPSERNIEPQTLADHIRKRRLVLKLSKKQAAARLGVTPATIRNWETGQTRPRIERIPGVLRFLGDDPFPEPKNIPERLLAMRRARGWSIRKVARQFGLDPTTWGDWERGKTILYRTHRALVAQLLGLSEREVNQAMAASRVCFRK
jgi:transcriptional regulator with XRE-family HTH domain